MPDVAEFDKGLHLRAFTTGNEWRIAALFEHKWWHVSGGIMAR